MKEKENSVRMQEFDFVKTVKTIDRWRKLAATVVTAEESNKAITASARSGACLINSR